MNKNSHQRCRFFNLHLNKLFISLLSTFIFIIIGTVSASAANPIKGVVTDAKSNEALIGVSIKVEGSSVGTITDTNGAFRIETPSANSVLVVSYIGYNTQKVNVSGQSDIKINLIEDTKNLDELIVVGYGVQKKSVVTGAISSLRSKDMENMNMPRVEDALKGRTAGVTVASNSGAPGAESSVSIRGITSINVTKPLYVVDGIAMTGGLDQINKSDIESIEVLKDAASAAIYGTSSAGGVILITTKKGKSGKTKVNLSSYYGTQAPAHKLDLLNASEYATLRNESSMASSGSILFPNPSSLTQSTDWQNIVFNNNASIQNHEISINGGSENSTFYGSFGYFAQDGIIATDVSSYKRYTVRLNSDHKIKKWLKIGNTLTYSHTKSKTNVSENEYFGGILASAVNLDPITQAVITDKNIVAQTAHDVRDNAGNLYGISRYVGQEMVNPLAYIKVNKDNFNFSDNLSGSVYVQLEPMKGLIYRSTLGGKLSNWGSESYTPLYYYSATQSNTNQNAYSRSRIKGLDWTFTNTLTYTKSINDHNMSVLLGTEVRDRSEDGTSVTYHGIPANSLTDASMNISLTSKDITAWGYENQPYKLLSYFGRLNYDYLNRYLLTAIIRRDGSSRFGSNNIFGNFPSISVGWNLSNESFWKENKTVDALKLRIGYGVNGSDQFDPFKYTSVMQNVGGAMFGNDQIYFGYAPQSPANPSLKWEKTTQINLGIDATLLRNLSISLDLYKKSTDGMLMKLQLPGYVGASDNPWANIASLENKGIELNATYNNRFGKFNFTGSGNIAYTVNKITNIGANDFLTIATMQASNYEIERDMVGYSANMFWGFKTAGVFQTQSEVNSYVNKNGALIQPNAKPGDLKWKDINGDGSITSEDRTKLGDSNPPLTYGITLKGEYKNFDMLVFGQGVAGNKISNQLRRLDVPTANYQRSALGRWTGPGTSNTYPRLTDSDTNGNFTNMSDFLLESGAYFRLKTLQIGYTLPAAILKPIDVDRIRVYLSSNNLFTLTKYSGYDPEIGGSAGIYSIDRGVYPQARSFMVGVDVTF